MSHSRTKRFILYATCFSLVALWWTVAFSSRDVRSSSSIAATIAEPPTLPPFYSSLSEINRDTLKTALAGDTNLMTQLLSAWDVDAKLMRSEGVETAQRLTEPELLQAHKLAHQLQNCTTSELNELRQLTRAKEIIDDTGQPFNLTHWSHKNFLPQTHASASILLALIEPKHIVALPRGIRQESHIYPRSLLSQIPLDADRYQSEKLFNSHPDLAFIAHYSLPSTVTALRNQGIEVFAHNQTDKIPDIIDGVVRMSHTVNRPLKGQLMAIFMKGAIMAIDNRAQLIQQSSDQWPSRVLYLNAYSNYSTPTARTLTAHLLNRLKLDHLISERESNQGSSEFSRTITLEEVVSLNPEYVLLSTTQKNRSQLTQRLMKEPALGRVEAVQQGHVIAVDESIQSSPSQYVVLAYFDLFDGITTSLGITSPVNAGP